MTSRTIIFAFSVAFLVAATAHADNQVQSIKFAYSGEAGPQNWGSLSADFRKCSEGKLQSPINILKKNTSGSGNTVPIQGDYINPNATLVSTGFHVALKFEGKVGSIFLNRKRHHLLQMIWHTPSEHTINDQRYPAELQLIHQSEDGEIAIMAYLYKYGDKDKFLLQLTDQLAELAKQSCPADHDSHVPVGDVDMKPLKRQLNKYWSYRGSLTAPPCTEGVTWIVVGKAREISNEQMASLKAPLAAGYKNNSRPVQPMNKRPLYRYDEEWQRKIVNAEI